MGNNCCRKRKLRRRLVLLLIGLDNAGKTKAVNRLAGDRLTSPVPTVGFSVIRLKYLNYDVKVFDLGGGPNIRGIWNKYFVDAHGVIFVVDSSDYSRLDEAKLVLEDVLFSEKIAGKPLLLLANKQDHENALDEIDIIEFFNIEQLVNVRKCPTLVQSCSSTEKNSNKLDPGIQKGYDWLLKNIVRNYDSLNRRVELDVMEQEKKEREEMLEKIQRIKRLHELEQNKTDEDAIESYSDYERKLSDKQEVKTTRNAFTLVSNNDHSSSPSETSSISLPPVYIGNNVGVPSGDRPKSAIDIVKHQLQLNNSARKNSVKSRTNKTSPIHLYGVKLPHSANERRRDYSQERRNLKSADDTLFTISGNLPNIEQMEACGDNYHKQMFQLKSLEIKNKLPPLNVKNNGNSWVHKPVNNSDNVISVVEIE